LVVRVGSTLSNRSVCLIQILQGFGIIYALNDFSCIHSPSNQILYCERIGCHVSIVASSSVFNCLRIRRAWTWEWQSFRWRIRSLIPGTLLTGSALRV